MKNNNYLTTKEFIKAVEEFGLDLTVEDEYEYYSIKDVDDDVIAHINKTSHYKFLLIILAGLIFVMRIKKAYLKYLWHMLLDQSIRI